MKLPFSALLRGVWAGLRTRRRAQAILSRGLRFEAGALIRTVTVLPARQLCSLSAERPLWLLPFRAARLAAWTPGRVFLRRTAFLPEEEAKALLGEEEGEAMRPDRLGRLLYAVGASDAAAGFALLLTALRLLTPLLGELLTPYVREGAGAAARLFGFLPAWAALLGTLAALGWGVALARTLLRLRAFTVTVGEKALFLRRGLPNRAVQRVSLSQIAAVMTRQHILLRPFGRATVFADAGGASPLLLLPAAKETERFRILSPQTLRPQKGAWLRFCLPGLFGMALSAFLFGAAALFGLWKTAARALSLVGVLLAGLRFSTGLAALSCAGAQLAGETLLLTVPGRRTVETLRLPLRELRLVSVRQSVWQRLSGRSCDLLVKGRGKTIWRLPALSLSETLRLFPFPCEK